MRTYAKTYRPAGPHPYVSQSRVVHSGDAMNGANRWSVQLMRSRHRYDPTGEKRGLTLFLKAGPLRAEFGWRR